nr:MAG TPA: hypothetical protein [Caudoviricetes sp.]
MIFCIPLDKGVFASDIVKLYHLFLFSVFLCLSED